MHAGGWLLAPCGHAGESCHKCHWSTHHTHLASWSKQAGGWLLLPQGHAATDTLKIVVPDSTHVWCLAISSGWCQSSRSCPAARAQLHRWSNGRIHRCHRCDPGSIPGRCTWWALWQLSPATPKAWGGIASQIVCGGVHAYMLELQHCTNVCVLLHAGLPGSSA